MSPVLSRVKSCPTEDSEPVLLMPHTACARELPKSRKALVSRLHYLDSFQISHKAEGTKT